MIKKPVYIIIFFAFAILGHGFAQDTSWIKPQPDSNLVKRYHVALFAPLYLDSAFDQASEYRYGTNFPKFFNSGLEFYEGAKLALDSLSQEKVPLDVRIFDSRSAASSVTSVIRMNALDTFGLIIGHVNANETRQLANAAKRLNIPFINATYPNDAGVSNNPDFVVLNSTLYTHCAEMYRFIQKNYALSPVVLFRTKGSQEDRLAQYFTEISNNTSSVPLKIRTVLLNDNFTPDDLKKYLKKDVKTICIAGSLEINFGEVLTQQLSSLYKDQPSVLFAMPTWWDATDFSKPEYRDVEVIYTTPFYVNPNDSLVVSIQDYFKNRFFSRPTDMVFRGYETMYHFAHLLTLSGANFNSSLSDKRFQILSDFNIQPVLNAGTNTLDYFENKKIYFVKKVNGEVTMVY